MSPLTSLNILICHSAASGCRSGYHTKDDLDQVRAVRATSKLIQTTVLDTQPTGYPNSSLVLLPAGGEQIAPFSPNFTQPEKVLLVQPCRNSKCRSVKKIRVFPELILTGHPHAREHQRPHRDGERALAAAGGQDGAAGARGRRGRAEDETGLRVPLRQNRHQRHTPIRQITIARRMVTYTQYDLYETGYI